MYQHENNTTQMRPQLEVTLKPFKQNDPAAIEEQLRSQPEDHRNISAIVFNPAGFRTTLARKAGLIRPDAWLGRFSPIELKDVAEPELRGPSWVRVRSLVSGISDAEINLIRGLPSAFDSPFVSCPCVPGREVFGVIEDTGDAVKTFRRGDRVVVNPYLGCEVRSISPHCENCANGNFSSCEHFAEGTLSPGLSIGYCADTGGGWSGMLLAHESQTYKIPAEVSDARAALIPAFSELLHPVLRNLPADKDIVLIYGCDSPGLMLTAAIRAAGSACTIIAVDEHSYRSELALHYGADRVIHSRKSKTPLIKTVADITGASIHKSPDGKMSVSTGFNVVFDTVGSPESISNSISFAAGGASVFALGHQANTRIDLNAVRIKNIRIAVASGNGIDFYNGRHMNTMSVAIDMVRKNTVDLSPLLTHKFHLKDYKQAFLVNLDKPRNRAIKTAFTF